MWDEVQNLVGSSRVMVDIDTVANLWDSGKTNIALNVVHATILWVLWLTRNDMCFKRSMWSGMQVIWRRSACTLAQWSILLSGAEKEKLNMVEARLETLVRAPPLLLWPEPG
jgi:hypothetical protein